MGNILVAGIVKKITLYSSNEEHFASWSDADEVISVLGDIIDLSSYDKKVEDGEVIYTLNSSLIEENIDEFWKEMGDIVGIEAMCDSKTQENYVEDDSIYRRLSHNKEALGVDIDFIEVWKVRAELTEGIKLFEIMERVFRKASNNLLGRSISFYVI